MPSVQSALRGWFFIKGSVAHLVQSLYGKRARGQSPFAEIEGEYHEVVAWCTGDDNMPELSNLCIPYWQQKKTAQFIDGTLEWIPFTNGLESQLEELSQAKDVEPAEAEMAPAQPKESHPKTAYSGSGGYYQKRQLYEGKYADHGEGYHFVWGQEVSQ